MNRSKSNGLQPLQATSLQEQIENQILNALLNGTYQLGEHLIESAIADQLGVSRAPVREVLAALQRDGIVVYAPRRGYSVIDFTEQDIEEIYSLRRLMELEAIRRAIPRMTEQDIAVLHQNVEEWTAAAIHGSDRETAIALDLSFHESICRTADHSRLYSCWQSLRLQSWLVIALTSSETHFVYSEEFIGTHHQILDAIVRSDIEAAAMAMKEHLLEAERRAMKVFQLFRSTQQRLAP